MSARIYLDVHGGDRAPHCNLDGVLKAAPHLKSEVVLVGKPKEIQSYIKAKGSPKELTSCLISPSEEVIGMHEKPLESIRKKRDASLPMACRLASENRENSAALSAGNSGAILAASLKYFGRVPEVERPAIAVLFPTLNDRTLVLDVGANSENKASHLVSFARLGSQYMRVVEDRTHPKVGLISNGEETSKGNTLTQKTHERLKECKDLNYFGYVEGNKIFSGDFDVMITDGFTGNALLKTSEGLAKTILLLLKEEIQNSLPARLGYFFLKPALNRFRKKVDYKEIGAAPLLGVNGLSFVAHGRSDHVAIASALKQIDLAIQLNLYHAFFNGKTEEAKRAQH
jgi:glycerol-3-phosphate acyltransferase PlsX